MGDAGCRESGFHVIAPRTGDDAVGQLHHSGGDGEVHSRAGVDLRSGLRLSAGDLALRQGVVVLLRDLPDLQADVFQNGPYRLFGFADQAVRDGHRIRPLRDVERHGGAVLHLGAGFRIGADGIVGLNLGMALQLRLRGQAGVGQFGHRFAARQAFHLGHADRFCSVQHARQHECPAGDDSDDQQQPQRRPPAAAPACRLAVVGVVVLNVRVLRRPRGQGGPCAGGGDDVVEGATRPGRTGSRELGGGRLIHRDALEGLLERLIELVCGLEAKGRVFGERLGHHRLHGGGDAIVEVGDGRRVFAHVLIGHRDGRVSGERGPVSEQLEQHTAGRVEITAVVHHLAAGLLGGEVLRGPDNSRGLRHGLCRICQSAGDAEVHDLHGSGVRDHDVGGFDVPVDDPAVMAVVQRAEDAGHIPCSLLLAQRLAQGVVDLLLQGVRDPRDGLGGGSSPSGIGVCSVGVPWRMWRRVTPSTCSITM